MKIIFFIVNKSPFNIQLADYLCDSLPSDTNVKVVAIYPMTSSRSQWGETHIHHINGVYEYPSKIYHFLYEENPDIVIYSGYSSKGMTEAKNWAKKNNKSFFLNCSEKLWEYNVNEFVLLLKYLRFKYIAKGITGAICVSNRGMKLYQHYLNVPVLMVPYCFDMGKLRSFEIKPYDGKELTFLISGRLEAFRDPKASIRLFKELKDRNPQIKMNLIISGLGSQYEEVIQLIKELNLESCTEWKNDFKKWTEIHDIYKSAHILLCLQEYGGWGLIVPEAMAAGLCVVASSEVDSADAYIIDQYNGVYANKKDTKTIISTVESLIQDKDHFDEIRMNARNSMKYADVQTYAKKLACFIMNYKK